MLLKLVIPYYSDYNVREKIDELFSREMLGAVIVGKFIGDFAALAMIDIFVFITRRPAFGEYIGHIVGIIVTVTLFIYWNIIEKKKEQAKEKLPVYDRDETEYCGRPDDAALFV